MSQLRDTTLKHVLHGSSDGFHGLGPNCPLVQKLRPEHVLFIGLPSPIPLPHSLTLACWDHFPDKLLEPKALSQVCV